MNCHRWIFAILVLLSPASTVEAEQVALIKVNGAIGPATASYISRGIHEAHAQGAQCLVIQLDTPGGLLESTKTIVQELLASPLPIITAPLMIPFPPSLPPTTSTEPVPVPADPTLGRSGARNVADGRAHPSFTRAPSMMACASASVGESASALCAAAVIIDAASAVGIRFSPQHAR